MDIQEKIDNYQELGLSLVDATAKVCGEIILYKISKSPTAHSVTIKGGVVLMNISKDLRRATRDLDLDFIKYSLADESIAEFIKKLNQVDDNIKLKIKYPITELKHQDYNGKQVMLEFIDDSGKKYNFKLDIGIHKNLKLEQKEFCFDLASIPETVTLLINTKEQILSEKLKSLLKIGPASSRYKDIFDFYYLIKINPVNKNKLKELLDDYIINDPDMWENNYEDIYNRLSDIFKNKEYFNDLKQARYNWLELPAKEVVNEILEYFKSL